MKIQKKYSAATRIWQIVLLALALLGMIYFLLPLLPQKGLSGLPEHIESFRSTLLLHPILSSAIFFGVYVATAAMSLPGATLLTLAAGALFGWFWGVLLVSFASTLGACLAFWSVRWLFRDWVRGKFPSAIDSVDAGFRSRGAEFLFFLRVVPLFPFFVVNLVMGLTPVSSFTFAWVSQLGMLPATILYVGAGVKLGSISSLSDLLTPSILATFTALGIFPFVAKFAIQRWQDHRALRPWWPKPVRFDFNLTVIGAGSAGLVATSFARGLGAKVALVEKHKMGGDCLNTGCVPSKTLLHLSRLGQHKDFANVKARIQASIAKIAPHDSKERFEGLGATVFMGEAKLLSPWLVRVGSHEFSTRRIILATGASPRLPAIPGIEKVNALTSDSVWNLNSLPQRLLIVGGGAIGCELGQAFRNLGSEVALVDSGPRLLARETIHASELIKTQLTNQGIHLFLNSQILEFINSSEALVLDQNTKEEFQFSFDAVLFAIGRKPDVAGLGLSEMGVSLNPQGNIEHDSWLRTSIPTIFVCGDAAGPFQLTHVSGHQAGYATLNALFGDWISFKEDLSVIPRCTFTQPEVASLGRMPEELAKHQIDFETTRLDFSQLDRAVCEDAQGFVEVYTAGATDRILGVSIVADRAGEMIAEWTLAMRYKMGLKKILNTVHAYPTFSDANKAVALAWQKKHLPVGLQKLAARYFSWQLGGNSFDSNGGGNASDSDRGGNSSGLHGGDNVSDSDRGGNSSVVNYGEDRSKTVQR